MSNILSLLEDELYPFCIPLIISNVGGVLHSPTLHAKGYDVRYGHTVINFSHNHNYLNYHKVTTHHKMNYTIYLTPLMGRCGHTDYISLFYVFIIRVLFPGGGVSLNDSDYFDVGKIIFELAKEVLRYHTCYNR